MSSPVIAEMTQEERNKFVYRHAGLRDCWTLYKVFINGLWHHGFRSREDAEWAITPHERPVRIHQ